MKNGPIRILLIEDNQSDRKAFQHFFEKNNDSYTYILIGSIVEAQQVLESKQFDLVITNYLLGDGTGFNIFGLAGDTPVIVITGSGNEEIAVSALKGGAYDYLIKDTEQNYLKVLPITIENAIKHKKAQEIKYQKEKLQGVIEMAGAACHELNQPLQAISGYSELLMMEMEESNPLYEMVKEIKKETNRMGMITRKLNNITRYETTDYVEGRKIIDINKASGKRN